MIKLEIQCFLYKLYIIKMINIYKSCKPLNLNCQSVRRDPKRYLSLSLHLLALFSHYSLLSVVSWQEVSSVAVLVLTGTVVSANQTFPSSYF